jgi:hypothetical protein
MCESKIALERGGAHLQLSEEEVHAAMQCTKSIYNIGLTIYCNELHVLLSQVK